MLVCAANVMLSCTHTLHVSPYTLPTPHLLSIISLTQTIRGVVITTSDSVESANGDGAFPNEVEIVEDILDTSSDPQDLIESASSITLFPLFPQVESDAVKDSLVTNFEDQRIGVTVSLTDKEVNIDLEFPYDTSLSIIGQSGNIWDSHRICDVRLGTDNKPMIANRAKYGLSDYDFIECAFHVVFPGQADPDGCDCDLNTRYHRDIGKYFLNLYGCDCLSITNIEGDWQPGIPESRDQWPCYYDGGCEFAPQLKLIVGCG
jgi:hypothetical protein